MEIGTIIFLSMLGLISLGLGVSRFIGNRAEAYLSLFFIRLLFIGVLLAIILVVSIARPASVATNDYLISYICLLLGSIFLLEGISILKSNKANAFWWRLVHRKEQKDDRKYPTFLAFILSFAFFFAFFCFIHHSYP